MSKMEMGSRGRTDADLIANLYTLVMRARAVQTEEAGVLQGEVILRRTVDHLFSVQLVRRDGTAVEFGRHNTLREAIAAAIGTPADVADAIKGGRHVG